MCLQRKKKDEDWKNYSLNIVKKRRKKTEQNKNVLKNSNFEWFCYRKFCSKQVLTLMATINDSNQIDNYCLRFFLIPFDKRFAISILQHIEIRSIKRSAFWFLFVCMQIRKVNECVTMYSCIKQEQYWKANELCRLPNRKWRKKKFIKNNIDSQSCTKACYPLSALHSFTLFAVFAECADMCLCRYLNTI